MDRGMPDGEGGHFGRVAAADAASQVVQHRDRPGSAQAAGAEPVELAKALQGAAEANALAAKGLAIERGVESEQIAGSEALALHAAAYNGMPDPVFHLVERAIGIVSGLVLGDAFVRHASDPILAYRH
jgi:hypothetical protein